MKYTVPENLAEAFIKIGWKRDGHRKFNTIFFGALFLVENPEIVLDALGFSDRNIIYMNLDVLKEILLL
jgi:hypothetical protein